MKSEINKLIFYVVKHYSLKSLWAALPHPFSVYYKPGLLFKCLRDQEASSKEKYLHR